MKNMKVNVQHKIIRINKKVFNPGYFFSKSFMLPLSFTTSCYPKVLNNYMRGRTAHARTLSKNNLSPLPAAGEISTITPYLSTRKINAVRIIEKINKFFLTYVPPAPWLKAGRTANGTLKSILFRGTRTHPSKYKLSSDIRPIVGGTHAWNKKIKKIQNLNRLFIHNLYILRYNSIVLKLKPLVQKANLIYKIKQRQNILASSLTHRCTANKYRINSDLIIYSFNDTSGTNGLKKWDMQNIGNIFNLYYNNPNNNFNLKSIISKIKIMLEGNKLLIYLSFFKYKTKKFSKYGYIRHYLRNTRIAKPSHISARPFKSAPRGTRKLQSNNFLTPGNPAGVNKQLLAVRFKFFVNYLETFYKKNITLINTKLKHPTLDGHIIKEIMGYFLNFKPFKTIRKFIVPTMRFYKGIVLKEAKYQLRALRPYNNQAKKLFRLSVATRAARISGLAHTLDLRKKKISRACVSTSQPHINKGFYTHWRGTPPLNYVFRIRPYGVKLNSYSLSDLKGRAGETRLAARTAYMQKTIPSFLTGLIIKSAGRIPLKKIPTRNTVTNWKIGACTSGKVDIFDNYRMTGKSRRGSYSLTIVQTHTINKTGILYSY